MEASDSVLSALSAITGTGKFHSSGVAPFFFPGLEVEGVGEIAFPLPASQAKELAAGAEPAPFGKGEETIHDESVRKCWQLDAARFSISSPEWQSFLGKALEHVRADLGITGKISAHPYKLLLYGEGGHFKAHRDTEKLDAMFGTLIVALPSAHEGGRLFIRHDGREIEVDFSRPEHRHGFQHAAFFADCEHEVEPVRSGYRCCLVYNLRLDEGDPGALNLPLDAQARTLLRPLAELKKGRRGELTAVLLEHHYTEANFSLHQLKGHDQARTRALFAAAKEAGFTAHLGLVTYHQMGELEEGGSRRRRRHWDDDDDDEPADGTMGEIYEESLSIGLWRDAADRPVPLGSYSIDEDALLTREEFGKGDPDEKEAEGYTGNAGCTMDYWYRRAAVVLWAREEQEEILCRYDFHGACRVFADLAGDEKKRRAKGFLRLGEAVVCRLMESLNQADRFHHLSHRAEHPFVVTLEALAKSGARGLLDTLMAGIPDEVWVLCDAPLWRRLHSAFGVDAFRGLYERMLAGDPDAWRHILFPILDALLAHQDGEAPARAIAARLAGLRPRALQSGGWVSPQARSSAADPGEARVLLAASHLLAPEARKAAFRFLLADQSLDHLRAVLVPILLGYAAALRQRTGSLYPELHAYAGDLLAAEMARPLPPFPDWVRPCPAPAQRAAPKFGHHPSYQLRKDAAFRELADFMADPDARTREFRHPQDIRNLLESYIATHDLDLDRTTLRKGSPHALACTKNDKSHQRALARRAADEKLLAQLEAS
jgi:hypothetical protein